MHGGSGWFAYNRYDENNKIAPKSRALIRRVRLRQALSRSAASPFFTILIICILQCLPLPLFQLL